VAYCYRCSMVSVHLSCVTWSGIKTAEPIQMPYQLWTRVGPGNHVLGMGPNPHGNGVYSAFLWRYEPVQRTGKSDDWLTIFLARIIRFTVPKFQLFWVIFCIIIFFIELWHFNFVISQNAKWGHAGFYIDCHRMTVPENILLQKSTGVYHMMWPFIQNI